MDPSQELYSEDRRKKILGGELETTSELDLKEAKFLTSKLQLIIKKHSSSRCKRKRVEVHKKTCLIRLERKRKRKKEREREREREKERKKSFREKRF